MSDDGTTKDDVKVPENEVGEKISKMFTEDGKDTSQFVRMAWTTTILADITSTDVIVLSAMGEEAAMDCKEAPK